MQYPRQALENKWQGLAEIRLAVNAEGFIEKTSVARSSGHEILDDQATEIVKRAKQVTPVPNLLQGREFSVDVPILFELNPAD
jgi:protein TonB